MNQIECSGSHRYDEAGHFPNEESGQVHVIWKCKKCPAWFDRPKMA